MVRLDAKKLFRKHKLYGTTVVGTKGQIVIPVKARKDLKIRPGDELLVLGRIGKSLGLVKPQELGKMVSFIMKSFDFLFDSKSKPFLKREVGKLLKTVSRYNK